MVLKFSNHDLEKRDGLYKAIVHADADQIVNINGFGQPFRIVCVEQTPHHFWSVGYGEYQSDCEHTITLMSVEKTKSKQEVEAEEAVERAKESLKSAEKVLESVKGLVN